MVSKKAKRGPSGGCAVSDSSVTLGHAVSIRFVWALEFLSQDDVYGGSAGRSPVSRDGGAVLLGTAVSAISLSGM